MAKRPNAPTKLTITSPLPGADTDKTIGGFIVDQLVAGVDPTNAALAAGVSSTEYRQWMRDGVEGLQRLDNGAVWEKDFTPEQQDIVVWAVEARRAHGRHIASLAARAQQLASGAPLERIIEVRDASNKLVETRTTTETQTPDGPMIRFLLERLAPETYGRDVHLDVTVHDVTDTGTVRTRTEERMNEILARYNIIADETEDEDGTEDE